MPNFSPVSQSSGLVAIACVYPAENKNESRIETRFIQSNILLINIVSYSLEMNKIYCYAINLETSLI
jgi:hypothetical protein